MGAAVNKKLEVHPGGASGGVGFEIESTALVEESNNQNAVPVGTAV